MSAQEQFSQVIGRARDSVRPGLDLCQRHVIEVAEAAPGQLRPRLEHIMGRKGKRVRATMMLLIGATGRPLDEQELLRQSRIAASLEMLHLASLVHDDVIDKSELRRGIFTANAEWGNKMAVLVGDYILSKSMDLAVTEPDRRIPAILSEASGRLVAGEVLELDLAGKLDASIADYQAVIDGKTASLFEACGRCGAILAGHNEDLVKACGELGTHFGMTFQIIDDLLDFGIGATDLGKAKFADLANGLVTLPLLLYFSDCSESERDSMVALLGKAGTDTSCAEQVKLILQTKGSFDKTMEMAMHHMHGAMAVLDRLPPGQARDVLAEVCGSMLHRSN
jgi:geranylgeranyl pyrophosphate synthase